MWMKRIGITATGSVLLLAGIGGAAAATHATSPPVADPTATSGTTASEQPAAREVVNQQTGERESEQVGEQESGEQQNGQESGEQQNGQVGEQESGEQQNGQVGEQESGWQENG